MKSNKNLFSITVLILCLLLLASTGLVGPTYAAEDGEDDDEDDDDNTVINIDLDEVVDAVQNLIDEFQNFTGDWDNTLKSVLTAVIFRPFRTLGQQLVRSVAMVLLNTPSVHPNPAVESVHRQVLIVTYILSTLGFATAGILYMIGPLLGVSYSQVRMILPRLVIALVFGSISLPLLQLGVDLSDALVTAFAPEALSMSFQELAGLSTGLVLVWVINAWLLLALVIIFILRMVYILVIAAISPLIALVWAIPKAKRYADTFIAGWFTALAMAPVDMLVLKFNLALMEGAGRSGVQSLSNWVLGIAGLVLLIWIPYQLYGASQAAIGQAYVITRGIRKHVNQSRNDEGQGNRRLKKQETRGQGKNRRSHRRNDQRRGEYR